ncbi:MAG: hypothetical protein GX774_01440 [Armatimonadetes bacterium]|jgi:hypothetical protein|nr:hypothetical protein [Armatimonadota bacterium]
MAIVAWGLLIYAAVGDKPRTWAYGVLPYVPGESFYATQRPRKGNPPRQMEIAPLLPGGKQ